MISLIYRCQIAGQCPLLFYAMYAQYAPGRHPKHRPGKRNHLFNRAPKCRIRVLLNLEVAIPHLAITHPDSRIQTR